MSTSLEYIEFVYEQIRTPWSKRYKKMFGEYMVYVNDKPVLLVCDNTVYVKKLSLLSDLMSGSDTGFPYEGAKEHYILDVEDANLTEEVIRILELVTPLPKKQNKK